MITKQIIENEGGAGYRIEDQREYYEVIGENRYKKLSENEFIESFKRLVQGKSEKEKEEILWNIINDMIGDIPEGEELPFERPTSIEEFYSMAKVDNITDLCKIGINSLNSTSLRYLEKFGLNDDVDNYILYSIASGPTRYYRVFIKEQYKYYKTLLEYQITPLDDNIIDIEHDGVDPYLVEENGTYKFKVNVDTGDEILVEVPVNEITLQKGTGYLVNEDSIKYVIDDTTTDWSEYSYGYFLLDEESGMPVEFDHIYVSKPSEDQSFKAKSVNLHSEAKDITFSYSEVDWLDEASGEMDIGDDYIIIIKDNKYYYTQYWPIPQ